MNDNLILILPILISGGIGAYIGMTITKLKSKSEQSTLEERQNQMSLTIDELKQEKGGTTTTTSTATTWISATTTSTTTTATKIPL